MIKKYWKDMLLIILGLALTWLLIGQVTAFFKLQKQIYTNQAAIIQENSANIQGIVNIMVQKGLIQNQRQPAKPQPEVNGEVEVK